MKKSQNLHSTLSLASEVLLYVTVFCTWYFMCVVFHCRFLGIVRVLAACCCCCCFTPLTSLLLASNCMCLTKTYHLYRSVIMILLSFQLFCYDIEFEFVVVYCVLLLLFLLKFALIDEIELNLIRFCLY